MALKMTDGSAKRIRNAGIALLLVGGALAAWGLAHFAQIPNYQRLLILVPFLVGKPMASVEAYRDWASVKYSERGPAIGFLLAPVGCLLGSLVWYWTDPQAMA